MLISSTPLCEFLIIFRFIFKADGTREDGTKMNDTQKGKRFIMCHSEISLGCRLWLKYSSIHQQS